MALLNNFNLIFAQSQLEQSHHTILHELGGDGAALNTWKLLLDEAYILSSLNDADLISTAFSLHGNRVMATMPIESNVKLVYFNLTDIFYSGTKMILQAVSCQPQKRIDQPVVTNDCEQGLLIV